MKKGVNENKANRNREKRRGIRGNLRDRSTVRFLDYPNAILFHIGGIGKEWAPELLQCFQPRFFRASVLFILRVFFAVDSMEDAKVLLQEAPVEGIVKRDGVKYITELDETKTKIVDRYRVGNQIGKVFLFPSRGAYD